MPRIVLNNFNIDADAELEKFLRDALNDVIDSANRWIAGQKEPTRDEVLEHVLGLIDKKLIYTLGVDLQMKPGTSHALRALKAVFLSDNDILRDAKCAHTHYTMNHPTGLWSCTLVPDGDVLWLCPKPPHAVVLDTTLLRDDHNWDTFASTTLAEFNEIELTQEERS